MSTQTTKYTCGCGKSYSSYPAFSTHKRQKHNNQIMSGTNVPHAINPKRGRPGYMPKKNTMNHINSNQNCFDLMTAVELAVLELDTKFKVMSEPHQEQPKRINVAKVIEERIDLSSTFSLRLSQAFQKISQMLTLHLKAKASLAAINFAANLAVFLMSSMKRVQDIQFNWYQAQIQEEKKIDCKLFNEFFKNEFEMLELKNIGDNCEVGIEYFVNLAQIYGQCLYKMNFTSNCLKRKC